MYDSRNRYTISNLSSNKTDIRYPFSKSSATHVLPRMPVCGGGVLNPESRKILWTRLKKGSWIRGETGCRFQSQREKNPKYARACGRLGSSLGKDAGVLFRLNYIFVNTLALDVIQVLDSGNYFQSCYGKQFLACAQQLSHFRTANRPAR